MKKKIINFILMIMGVCMVTICSSSFALEKINTRSCGNVRFMSEEGEILLCGEDIAYLLGKMSSIPEDVYEPEHYTHLHIWDYEVTDNEVHVRKCRICTVNEMVSHISCGQESCNFSYRGKIYSGVTYICDCGYRWTQEVSHNVIYEEKNGAEHVLLCELDGSEYCNGREQTEEQHSYLLEPEKNSGLHLQKCYLCGFGIEEECDYTSYSEKNDDLTVSWFCECGNYITSASDFGNGEEDITKSINVEGKEVIE